MLTTEDSCSSWKRRGQREAYPGDDEEGNGKCGSAEEKTCAARRGAPLATEKVTGNLEPQSDTEQTTRRATPLTTEKAMEMARQTARLPRRGRKT